MSRARSAPARGASAAGGRPAGGRPGVFVQTPRSDIYVTMLGVALGAMILGCILLLLIWKRYDFQKSVSSLDAPSRQALAWASGKSEKLATVHL